MARQCTVCTHSERETIDRRIASGSSNLSLSAEFGVSESAVRRHAVNHLPATVSRAAEAAEEARALDLLGQIRQLQSRTLALLDLAEARTDLRGAVMAIREARSNIETESKLKEGAELERRLQALENAPHSNGSTALGRKA